MHVLYLAYTIVQIHVVICSWGACFQKCTTKYSDSFRGGGGGGGGGGNQGISSLTGSKKSNLYYVVSEATRNHQKQSHRLYIPKFSCGSMPPDPPSLSKLTCATISPSDENFAARKTLEVLLLSSPPPPLRKMSRLPPLDENPK